jgi:hypothetical protein
MDRSKQMKATDKEGSFLQKLRMFDIYTKLDEDFRVQTVGGGYLSLLGWFFISILVVFELRAFMQIEYKEHMVVDTTLQQKLKINVHMTFHALTCADVHLDAMDVAGDNQLSMEQDMYKQRISEEGEPIGDMALELIGHVGDPNEFIPPLAPDACESCFGAESDKFICCNTCNDLREAYKYKGWNDHFIVRNSTQCMRDSTNPFSHVGLNEGCRVRGSLLVNKVAGNVHMALGTSVVRDGAHIHQFLPAEAPGFNVSHTIHSITFGEIYHGMPLNPLDNIHRHVDEDIGTGLYQYFIKVIPTIYIGLDSRKIFTNQFTYTEKFRPIGPPKSVDPSPVDKPAVIPGIFFIYEISPFLIEIKRIRMPFLHLLTRLCAIVGGVFSIFGVIDATVFRIQNLISRKK